MKIASTLLIAAVVAMPGVAVAETYQLWLEMFDETRGTTVCKYRSRLGKNEVTEYAGRYLCPRVACEIPPVESAKVADNDCVPMAALPVS